VYHCDRPESLAKTKTCITQFGKAFGQIANAPVTPMP